MKGQYETEPTGELAAAVEQDETIVVHRRLVNNKPVVKSLEVCGKHYSINQMARILGRSKYLITARIRSGVTSMKQLSEMPMSTEAIARKAAIANVQKQQRLEREARRPRKTKLTWNPPKSVINR